MKNVILKLFIFISFSTVACLGYMLPAYAACPGGNSAASQVLSSVNSAAGGNCNDSGVINTANAAVNVLSIVAGIAAVIMIVIAGYKYITSGGESGKVSSAKSTLIYALVGVAVAALAQILVHFVLYQSNKATNSSSSSSFIQEPSPSTSSLIEEQAT